MTLHQHRAIAPSCDQSDTAVLSAYLERTGCFLIDFFPNSMALRRRVGLSDTELDEVAFAGVKELIGEQAKPMNDDELDRFLNEFELDGLYDLRFANERSGQFRIMSRVVGAGHIVVLLIPTAEDAPASLTGVTGNHADWREKLFDLILFGSGFAGRADFAARHGLSPRMIECLRWTAVGKTSEEIGMILDLSGHTVNNYLSVATQKLNAVNRVQAVAYAISLGIITVPPAS